MPATPPRSPTRLSRRLFLWTIGVASLLLPWQWLVDEHWLLHVTVPVRSAFLVLIGLAVWRRVVSQASAERTLFWYAMAVMVLRVATLDAAEPERAVLQVALGAPIMLVLAMLLAPRHTRLRWMAAVLAANLVPGAFTIGPDAPQLYAVTAVLLCLNCLVLAVLEHHAREAEATSDLAFTDALTGLANRRAVQIHLNAAIARTVEGGTPDALVLLDLDRFKALNDSLGHGAGDDALRQVATALLATARRDDVVGRWGGEEFVVLCHQASEADAGAVAERMRAAVERATPVTASFGVAAAHQGDTLTGWVRRADLALYRAKESGRNTVVMAAGAVRPDLRVTDVVGEEHPRDDLSR